MTTLNSVITAFLEETGIGFVGTADASPGSAATVTDITELSHAYGPNDYKGHWVWFPLATGNNIVNRATTVTTDGTGVLSTVRAYASNTATAYRLLKPQYHPTQWLVPLANRALQECWQYWRTSLTVVANGDGEGSAVGGSDSNSSTTRDVVAADVWAGEASLRVANSGANGYHQYATFDAAENQPFTFGVFVRITVGVATVDIRDITNGTSITSTTVTGVGQWHYVQLSGTFPDGCYQAAVRVGAQEATGDTNWDDACLYWQPMCKVTGPSWVTEWRLRDGTNAFRLYKAWNRLVDDGSGPALAYGKELVSPTEYEITNIPTAANPVELELGTKVTSPMAPIIIEARRPYYSFGAVSADTDASDCPVRLWTKAMIWLAMKEQKPDSPEEKARYRDYIREQLQGQPKFESPPPDNIGGSGMAWVRL